MIWVVLGKNDKIVCLPSPFTAVRVMGVGQYGEYIVDISLELIHNMQVAAGKSPAGSVEETGDLLPSEVE